MYKLLWGLTAAATMVWAPAYSQPIEEFYKRTDVQIVVGHEPGTGFDLYARTLARHMSTHIPGKPAVIVQNMVGASGLNAFNWLANAAPKDGSVFATAAFTVPFEPLFGNKAARFDASKLGWIGNMDSSVSICGVSKESGVNKFEDALRQDVLLGSTGHAGPLSQSPRALRELVGARFKIIEGYKGSSSVKLAIERGEVHGVCGISLSTVRTQYRDIHESGLFRLILQIGPEPHPDLQDVPHVYQFAKGDDDRAVFDLLFGAQGLGRSFVAPAGLPEERLEALRQAFEATMTDKNFLAEAKKINLDLRPQSGRSVQAFIQRIYLSPPSVIERARKAIGR
jgi:tripartite-type tricarboxylate transporter receptor subunit TctC